jgi:hypothetical protein
MRVKRSKQSARSSWIESGVDTLLGMVIAVCAQIVLFPLFGIAATITDNVMIAVLFMLIGLPRRYVVRRFFEWLRVTGWLP